MKKLFVLLFVVASLAFSQGANHVVISEVGPMGGASSVFNTGEFIELYNPTPSDITFGANVTISSGEGSGANAAAWTLSLAGKTIKAYGFYLIGDGGAIAVTPDVAFPASKNLSNGNSARAYVQLKDGAAIIDAFGWDKANVNPPNCEGTAFTPSNSNSDKKSFERKSGPLATAPDTLGNAWDTENNSVDFFENAAAKSNPQNSSSKIEKNPYETGPANPGSASILPARWKYNTPTNVTVKITVAGTDSLKGIRIIKPNTFTWNSASITVHPNTVTITNSNDTTTLTNVLLKGTDSVVISIPNVTAADSTNDFSLSIRTSKDGNSFSGIATQPTTLVYGTPRPVAMIKKKEANGTHSLLGKWVVTKGVVTVANEFLGPSYLQDGTTGFAIYDSSVSNYIERGDEIVLLGKVAPFNELFELVPAIMLEKISEGNYFDTAVVAIPQVKGQPQAGVEQYEGKLIRINKVSKVLTLANQPTTTFATSGSGTNYKIVVGTDTLELRVSSRTNLANLAVPGSIFDVVGALGQFGINYQILPRSYHDIIVEGSGPRIISGAPYETGITTSSITFVWQTETPGTSIANYGTTTAYGNTVIDTNKVTLHQLTVTGLQPATIYNVQLGSANANGTTYTVNNIVSTSSLTSTGVMQVYFNQSVNTALARGENAQVANLSTKLIERINAATKSIDVSLYSLSGTAGANVATALILAQSRGVKVRVIGEKDNQTTAPWNTLKNAGIPVIDDGYDAVNAGAGLMHNKFVVFDNRDTTSDTDDWAWTGSWNVTDPGTNNDAQNAIAIQDKALANAYTVEFEEMWGSRTETPNAANSRFGARKVDNTPHFFVINNTPVELYFSPSDRTNAQILKTVSKAKSSINFGLLTFTRSDVGTALVNKKKAGVKVRGVVDNRTDSGAQFDTLLAQGIDIFLKKNLTGMLHHKYAIFDADVADSNQYVLTGSHNWSSSAENINNENTLIIKSKRIANLFLQEFSVRYTDAGGKDALLSVERNGENIPSVFSISQNYPNPFNPATVINYQLPMNSKVTLKIYDVVGREVAALVNDIQNAGNYTVTWNASNISSGVYFYQIQAGNYTATKRMILMK